MARWLWRIVCELHRHKIDWNRIDRNGFRCARCGTYVRGDEISRDAVRRWRERN